MKTGVKTSLLMAAAASLSLAFANGAFAWTPQSSTHTVRNDHGGRVIDYAIRMNELKQRRASVKFDGLCDSACTLFLALPSSSTCVTSKARFGFHLPFGSNPRGNAVAAQYLMRSYPGWVQNWIRTRGGLSHHLKVMTYEYASRYLPECEA